MNAAGAALNVSNGAVQTRTSAQIVDGGASGTFDIASGELKFTKAFSPNDTRLAGTVKFLDANGLLAVRNTGETLSDSVVRATINGFQAGDRILLADAQSKLSLTPGSVGGRSYLSAHYNGSPLCNRRRAARFKSGQPR